MRKWLVVNVLCILVLFVKHSGYARGATETVEVNILIIDIAGCCSRFLISALQRKGSCR
ncbi:hypothetical protein HF324_02110 [Chitinophaga oryzae]|uniref:Uncharacterized protein n=1 Tax=Chitinophaga oryzae TaxID=2725414 RepID=A0ABX6L9C1_9BACT|nr:hypothetical protein [Chitinophaga oryzae]QJB36713.1 hypothetical protein HF324_02110 [Chitinophaga oryzae]